MPSPSEQPLERVCIRLYKADYEAIRQMAETIGTTGGINTIIREIVHRYIKGVRDLERRNIDELNRRTPEQNP